MARTKKGVLSGQQSVAIGAGMNPPGGMVLLHTPPPRSPNNPGLGADGSPSFQRASNSLHAAVIASPGTHSTNWGAVGDPVSMDGDQLAIPSRKRPVDASQTEQGAASKLLKLENSYDVSQVANIGLPISGTPSVRQDYGEEDIDLDSEPKNPLKTPVPSGNLSLDDSEKRASLSQVVQGPGQRSRRQYDATWNTFSIFAKRKFPDIDLDSLPVDARVPKVVEAYIHQRCTVEGCGMSFAAIVRSSVKFHYKYGLGVPDQWSETNRGNPADSQELKDYIKSLELRAKKENGEEKDSKSKRGSGRFKDGKKRDSEGNGHRAKGSDGSGLDSGDMNDIERLQEEIASLRGSHRKEMQDLTHRLDSFERQIKDTLEIYRRSVDTQKRALESVISAIKSSQLASFSDLNFDALMNPELEVPPNDGDVSLGVGSLDDKDGSSNKNFVGLLTSWLGES